MTISNDHLAALEDLGYTAEEARFLYITATHSGYFQPCQFLAFAGGKRSNHFARKLESRGHAGWREYPHLGGVYHLSSKTLYRRIGKDHLRNWRRHSTEFIRTRLIVLDFVLANQAHLYLETEPEKTAYFCEQLGLPTNALPAKAYARQVRYFVDRFPLFLDRSDGSLITFSYVDSGEATVRRFVHHLDTYTSLFVHLTDFRFVFISNSPVLFIPAEKCFSAFAKRVLEQGVLDDLSRYFRLRSAWDQRRFGTLSNADVEWLEHAHARFRGEDTERQYAAWSSGQLTDHALMSPLCDTQLSRRFDFRTDLVAHGRTVATELGKAG